MRIDAFDFHLPEENIALRPAEPRDAAKMLVVDPTQAEPFADAGVLDLPDLLQPGDALVFNNTKVIPARLEGTRTRGDAVAKVGVTLHMKESSDTWRAFVQGAKKLKVGETVQFADDFNAKVEEKNEGGEVLFRFNVSAGDLDGSLASYGHIPLPPYIASKRPEDEKDRKDYQTIYAEKDGAVAAPTAGLHFTDALFDRLDARGISRHFVTLHVGAGTFLPVKVDDTDDHKMHSEWGLVDQATADELNAVRAAGGRIVAVGTTSLRLLESAASDDRTIKPWSGPTDIFIQPGYHFKAIDALMTNFHLPKSTLFMLVSALSGLQTMQAAYGHAIANGYRFYSYGDSSLLFPAPKA
ncbi:tRNA preQ1(34) S-adenosylmethionine ribosyltransferase-isomerase QueA [Pseudahrensia aquimaris]|uniref:S-adenosylmethionine:tRNA ribosyltransferase-isomerase n=1 Tax=Pseudahrensia aquimaris TaxID=744461 RepID=A0ABW3FHE6_9HYPH